MRPNTPPYQPGNLPEDGEIEGFRYSDVDQGRGYNDTNPYYANQQRASTADLDANAPLLKSNDLQRLNRKALLFLAGIIALLILMAIWMLSSASNEEEKAAQPREVNVRVPQLPADPTATAPPVPMEAMEYPAAATSSMDEMPPIPIEDTRRSVREPSFAAPVAVPREPTLVERRMSNVGIGEQLPGSQQDPYIEAMLAGIPGTPANTAVTGNPQQAQSASDVSSAQFINNPDALLVRGTYLRCVLETRIITDVPGFTSCIVTEPIYSINGRRLLLPKGSKILGRYDTEPTGPRIAVVWDRITTPNGIDVSIASPGVDNLGGAGHPGGYNAHWASRITSALLISLISDAFKYAGAEYGPVTTRVSDGIVTRSPFESNTARTMERLANQAINSSARRSATVSINQGTVVNVYVAKDVDFSGVLARN